MKPDIMRDVQIISKVISIAESIKVTTFAQNSKYLCDPFFRWG